MTKYLTLLSLLFTTTASAVDLVLVQYTFTGGTFNPTTLNSGLTADAINTTGSTATIITSGVTITNTMNYNQNSGSTSAALAITNNSFFQFTVTPNAGNFLNLGNLSFEAAKGGASAPRGYDLRSSLDSYATSISSAEITTVATVGSPVFQNFSIPLSGPSYLNISSPVTFRLYGYTPTVSATLTWNSITLSSVSVPEPSTVLLSIAAVSTLVWTGWRQSKVRKATATATRC